MHLHTQHFAAHVGQPPHVSVSAEISAGDLALNSDNQIVAATDRVRVVQDKVRRLRTQISLRLRLRMSSTKLRNPASR